MIQSGNHFLQDMLIIVRTLLLFQTCGRACWLNDGLPVTVIMSESLDGSFFSMLGIILTGSSFKTGCGACSGYDYRPLTPVMVCCRNYQIFVC